ncbi:MAG: putative lipid II flippase FtsW [bacterium]|nr:putative lipid II flippase FtsW [bacterium]
MRGKTRPKKIDYFFILLVFLLTAFGLAMLASASSDLGNKNFHDTYSYLKHQVLYGLLPGLLGFFIMANVYYRRLEKISFILLIVSLGLLILVFTSMGVLSGGARRWLALGNFSFQPSEIVKFAFLIYLAAWLSKNKDRTQKFLSGFLPLLCLLVFICGILLVQHSTSAAMIIGISAVAVYFISGARFRYILAIILLGVSVLFLVINFTPYRFDRIKAFLNPQADPLGKSYQQNQTLLAIGSGQLWGRGYGQSTTKIHYLPEPISDSIFAVIAEELGFVGSTGLIVAFFLLIWRSFAIAGKNPDNFAKIVVIGFGLIVGLQVFIHIAALTGVIPLTGVPLPFISYGGTALAVSLTMAGVVANISKYSY